MSFNYSKTAATVTRLLQRFGASATLTSVTGGTYDPSTGGSTGETTTNTTVTAAVFDFSDKQDGAQFLPGTLILAGDKQVFMAVGTAPVPGNTLTWQSVIYQVVAVKTLAPAGVAVLYELLVRR